jgi:hypothetical protein
MKTSVTKPQVNPSFTGISGIANKLKGLKGKAKPKAAKSSPAGRTPRATDSKLSYA